MPILLMSDTYLFVWPCSARRPIRPASRSRAFPASMQSYAMAETSGLTNITHISVLSHTSHSKLVDSGWANTRSIPRFRYTNSIACELIYCSASSRITFDHPLSNNVYPLYKNLNNFLCRIRTHQTGCSLSYLMAN